MHAQIWGLLALFLGIPALAVGFLWWLWLLDQRFYEKHGWRDLRSPHYDWDRDNK